MQVGVTKFLLIFSSVTHMHGYANGSLSLPTCQPQSSSSTSTQPWFPHKYFQGHPATGNAYFSKTPSQVAHTRTNDALYYTMQTIYIASHPALEVYRMWR